MHQNYTLTLMMEVSGSSETLVRIYRTTRGYIESIVVVETIFTREILGSEFGR
jgi:hypothetical protein